MRKKPPKDKKRFYTGTQLVTKARQQNGHGGLHVSVSSGRALPSTGSRRLRLREQARQARTHKSEAAGSAVCGAHRAAGRGCTNECRPACTWGKTQTHTGGGGVRGGGDCGRKTRKCLHFFRFAYIQEVITQWFSISHYRQWQRWEQN